MDKITLILGAGASKEVGLPVGNELKTVIANLLKVQYEDPFYRADDSNEIVDAFRVIANKRANLNLTPYIDACLTIRAAMPQAISIDNYLDAHAGNDLIEMAGKLGIAKSILDAERKCELYIDPQSDPRMINFNNVEKTWFNKFFQILTENCRLNDLAERLSRIKIISFNYDRCFLHYMKHAIQNYFRVDENTAVALLKYLEIFHPYGKVGSLPWEGNEKDSIAFGASANGEQLVNLITQIRTFTQGTDPETSKIEALRKSLITANRLVFLGFAYHRLNMELMSSNQPLSGPSVVYGTALGISDPDSELIEDDVRKLTGKTIKYIHIRNDLSCEKLFEEYWRTMSMA